MNFLTNIIVKFRDLIKSTEKSPHHPESSVKDDDQTHLMSDDEKLDEALEETFPASDPLGHISKSAEDLRQY